jgi:uncharacterized membrane protein
MTEGAPSGFVPVQEWLGPDNGPRRVNLSRSERLASTIGGGLLALWGLRRGSLGLILSGGAMVYRGISGHCPVYEQLEINTAKTHETPVPNEVKVAFTIARPREAVYAAWRKFENWPRFMRHLESVTRIDDRRYHWVARAAQGLASIEWDIELVEDRENELIAWQSLPAADFHNAGWMSCRDALNGGGTEVHVELLYRPYAGDIGFAIDRWFTPITRQLIEEDIRRFKNYMEMGETVMAGDQPYGHL